MAVVGYNEQGSALKAQLDAMGDRLNAQIDEICLAAAVEGEATIKEVIDTTESGLSPGKDNRNWTFHMNNSVDSDVIRTGNKRRVLAGWLKVQEPYFLYQEYGADFSTNRKPIPPMDALGQAFNVMDAYIGREIARLGKRN